MCDPYRIQLLHIFEIPGTSTEFYFIANKMPSILNVNQKAQILIEIQDIRIRNFEILVSHTLNTQYFKKGVKSRTFSGFYVCLLGTGYLVKISSFQNTRYFPRNTYYFKLRCEKPSTSKFLIRNTQYFNFEYQAFHLNTRYFENM